ncbi:MAG: hypothetical protein AMJ54_08590 [Deltaproteobacteria bacterium SG8_13]|nr:MAG: hypothetical protein AMJ54_08590 [Deltaproteobacteria bacterium SG8_13]
MNQDTGKVLKELIGFIPAAIVPSLLGFVSVAVFSRYLPPEEYGDFTLVFTTAVLAHTFAFSWINQSIIRYYERFAPQQVGDFFSTCVTGFFILSVLVALGWLIVTAALNEQLSPRLWKLLFLGPLIVFFYSGSNMVLAFNRAMRDSVRYSLLSSINAVMKLLVALLLIYFVRKDAASILGGIILAGGIVLIPEIIRLSRRWGFRLRGCNRSMLVTFIKFGGPLVGLALSNIILSSSDRYIIAYFLDSDAVGVYSAGYKITETAIMFLVTFLMWASFPALVSAYEKSGDSAAVALMDDLLKIYVILIFPAMLGLTVLSEDITGTLLDRRYFDAHKIVPWIASGIFFMGLSFYYSKSFELRERTLFLFALFLLAAMANILLNIILIPILGLQGAAISTMLAYFICFLLSSTAGSRLLAWHFPFVIFLKALAAGGLMCLVVYFVPDLDNEWLSLFSKILIGFVVYTGALLVLERDIKAKIILPFVDRRKDSLVQSRTG